VELLTGEIRTANGAPWEGELQVRVESDLPGHLAVGAGNAIFVSGFCFHPRGRIRELGIGPAAGEVSAIAHGMPRPDVADALDFDAKAPGESLRSGFWAIVPFEAVPEPESVELGAVAKLEDGTTARASLGSIRLDPGLSEGPVATANGHGPGPLVAICMATYEPPLDLLERQVESIRAQTHANWICVVSDDRSSTARLAEISRMLDGDPRFVISSSPRRLGHYRNFERALSLVPSGAAYAMLADQDDRWYPDKLEALLGAIGNAELVYSDARIVDRGGAVTSETFWSGRRNNYKSFASLLIANTVTGAASLFRRELLDLALPFPPRHGSSFADHWLAVVALATGRIAYVDRPLYDYVQHRGAAIGHARANALERPERTTVERWRRLMRSPRAVFDDWKGIYFWDLCRLRVLVTVLERRCGMRMQSRKRRAARLLAASEGSPRATTWLALRAARGLVGRNETLGAEGRLLRGIAWRRIMGVLARGRGRPTPWSRGDASLPALPERPGQTPVNDSRARALSDKLRPLELDIRAEAPARINLLIPTIDVKHFFGGYIAKLNLARRLADQGLRVRLVAVDETPPLPRTWQRTVESYSGLGGALDRLELGFARQGGALEVNPRDQFIATTWWTAHLAHGALAALERERFLYLVQEYEPFTFPMGAFAALAAQSYELPHFGLFSTDLLRDYFRRRGLGVFSAGEAAGERGSAAFDNAITPVDAPSAGALAARRSRRLLCYSRPESHAARNMFELGILALAEALADGVLGEEWELRGVGAVGRERNIELGSGRVLELLPRRSQSDYARLLSAHDVGLALMYTPHPSLPPIEMAAAGMLTVTNTFENKTAEAMTAISSNLIAVEPSLEGLATGLREAVARVDDFSGRERGGQVRWSRDWDRSFDDDLMRRITSFLDAC
jgi:glycosyltransferase involved in cell wall biosynthesis